MRILDETNNKTIDSVLIMLTKNEAKEFLLKISSLNPKEGDHVHINDLSAKREITILIYTSENLKFYSPEIQGIIGNINE